MLDLRGISTFTDFFVICSATSEPQLKAIASEIETQLKEERGTRPVAIDGFPASQWIVLDYLQVVVHVFHRDKRAFYSLEDLWGDATRVDWEPAASPRVAIDCRSWKRCSYFGRTMRRRTCPGRRRLNLQQLDFENQC